MFWHLLHTLGHFFGVETCFVPCPFCKGFCGYLKGHPGTHRCPGCTKDFN